MIDVRIEISSLATNSLSGVSNYTKMLGEALSKDSNINLTGTYFNFLNRQPVPNIKPNNGIRKNTIVPLRLYAKLQSYGLAPPFDIFLPKTNLTIFPNFATWPTIHSNKTATVIHDLTYVYFPELVEQKNLPHLRRVVPRSIKKADLIITVSESVKKELIKEFNISPESCIVTPIPPSEEYFKKSSINIAKKYKLPSKKYIYFVGNLEPRKNLPVLINAYCLLPDIIKKEYCLVLAGARGWKTEESDKALAAAIKSGEKIVHLGFISQNDSPALYQNASLVVMPSLYEGFGMPVVEAMASKTPVLCSDIPVLRETGGNACLYAKRDSPDDFANKIEFILRSNKLQKDLVSLGYKHAKSLSWSYAVNSLKNKLLSML